jgi:hypothetical protein
MSTIISLGSRTSFPALYLYDITGTAHQYRVAVGFSPTGTINNLTELSATESALLSASATGIYTGMQAEWVFTAIHSPSALVVPFAANYAALITRKAGVDTALLVVEELILTINPTSLLTTIFKIGVKNV